MEYDVVVVGAGPAGSLTARYAAEGGATVLMIEKRQEIGSPVRCGEGIARHFLEECNIPYDRRWVAIEVKGAKVISPGGKVFKIDERHAGNEVGIVVERDMFDKTLAKHAAKAGAEIWVKTTAFGLLKENGKVTGVRVGRLSENMDIKAKVIVGADGYESQVGRWAGIKTILKAEDVTATLQYRLTNIQPDEDFPNYCEFLLGSIAPGGYIWVFPKDECTANVGIGLSLDRLKEPNEIRGYLDRWIAKEPRMKKAQMLDMVTGAVSTCAPIDETVRDGVALVGDAARLVDPITGGGIGNGCRAGKILGEVLGEAARTGDWSLNQLMKYERGWRAILEEGLYRNWMAKNKLVTLTDEEFDLIIGTLAEVGVEKLSIHRILKVIKERHPQLVEKFLDLI
jgi:digeranylgeranylglycerophospholipid reductase